MTKKSFRARPNKTEQIAKFLLGKGSMTSRQIFDAGFRFEDGEETSPYLISVLLNKMHISSRYTVERTYIGESGGSRVTAVKVLSIANSRYGNRGAPADISGTELNLWRQLLTRKHGMPLCVGVAA